MLYVCVMWRLFGLLVGCGFVVLAVCDLLWVFVCWA